MARILVVEDDLLSRQLVCDVLTHDGHEVVEAGSTDEAEAALRANTFDLVLADISIPGSGETLLRRIRTSERWQKLPVIAVTALAMHGDRERLIANGFDDYLSKPIATRKLAELVAETLRHHTPTKH